MNTYRVYVLNTQAALAPVITIAYVQAEKYGPAWEGSRASLNGTKEKAKTLFLEPECKTDAKLGTGDHLTVAKIVDIKPRNVKLDKAALGEVLNGEGTAEEKLAAMAKMLAGQK